MSKFRVYYPPGSHEAQTVPLLFARTRPANGKKNRKRLAQTAPVTPSVTMNMPAEGYWEKGQWVEGSLDDSVPTQASNSCCLTVRRMSYVLTMILLIAGVMTFSTLFVLKVHTFILTTGTVQTMTPQAAMHCPPWRPEGMEFSYRYQYQNQLYDNHDSFCLESIEVPYYQRVITQQAGIPVYLDPVNPNRSALSIYHLVNSHPICQTYGGLGIGLMILTFISACLLPFSGFL